MKYEVSGYTWYRVKLANGTQGYIASKYLTNEIVPKEKFRIEENYIIVAPGTVIEDIEGATNNSEKFATGSSITLENANYTLVMLGDVNGDGDITPLDYVKIKNHIMNINSLEGCHKMAADVNGDGNITPLDYVKVKNHIMNISKISL